MPTPIIFTVTQAGRDAAANALNNLPSQKLRLSTVRIGSGQYTPTGNETSLQSPLVPVFSIGGGGVETGSGQIRFTPIFRNDTTLQAFEIGLYDDNNVLFAIAATPTSNPLMTVVANMDCIFACSAGLVNVDANSIEVSIDVNAPLALVLMGQHVAAAHPHSQYKRTLDNTERLKVSTAVANDDAVRLEQLVAEATARANADLSLAISLAAENTGRENADVALSDRIDSEATARASADMALSIAIAAEITNRQNSDDNLQNNKAEKGGSNAQRFKIAPAVDNDDAVRKDELVEAAMSSFKAFGVSYIQIFSGVSIIIPPKETRRIVVIGGGGGSAGYFDNNDASNDGQAGGDSFLTVSGVDLCRANGGLGAIHGRGSNGVSQYPPRGRSAVSINGNFLSQMIVTSKNDPDLISLSKFNNYGQGGGTATDNQGVSNVTSSGEAGHGGVLEFIIKNVSSTVDLVLTATVGTGGAKTGGDALDGYAGVIGLMITL